METAKKMALDSSDDRFGRSVAAMVKSSAVNQWMAAQASDFGHVSLMNNFRISIISIQLHLRNIQVKRKPSTVRMTLFE